MLETFTVETFTPHVGSVFRVVFEDGNFFELALASAAELGSASAREWSKTSGRAPFTLEFLGPKEHYLPQGTYRLEHPKLEPLEIFLVPIGPDERAMQYEAVFT